MCVEGGGVKECRKDRLRLVRKHPRSAPLYRTGWLCGVAVWAAAAGAGAGAAADVAVTVADGQTCRVTERTA